MLTIIVNETFGSVFKKSHLPGMYFWCCAMFVNMLVLIVLANFFYEYPPGLLEAWREDALNPEGDILGQEETEQKEMKDGGQDEKKKAKAKKNKGKNK